MKKNGKKRSANENRLVFSFSARHMRRWFDPVKRKSRASLESQDQHQHVGVFVKKQPFIIYQYWSIPILIPTITELCQPKYKMSYANPCLMEIELREIFWPLVTIRFFGNSASHHHIEASTMEPWHASTRCLRWQPQHSSNLWRTNMLFTKRYRSK